MAFKKREIGRRKIELISLIDVVFLLLLFFLITSFVIHLSKEEQKLDIPTPENRRGRTQILIQLLEGGRFFWIDENSAAIVQKIREENSYLPANLLNTEVLRGLERTNTFSETRFRAKLRELIRKADEDPRAKYFVLIRCPNEIPYFKVVDIIRVLSGSKYGNIKYGCIGGSIAQIRNCKKIETLRELDPQGRERDNIYIDF